MPNEFVEGIITEAQFFEQLRTIVCSGCTSSIFCKDSEGIEGTCRANLNNLIKCMENDYKEYMQLIDETL